MRGPLILHTGRREEFVKQTAAWILFHQMESKDAQGFLRINIACMDGIDQDPLLVMGISATGDTTELDHFFFPGFSGSQSIGGISAGAL